MPWARLDRPTLRRGQAVRPGQAVHNQTRDGYEVQGVGREAGGSEVLWGARVVCGCETGCEVLAEYGVSSG